MLGAERQVRILQEIRQRRAVKVSGLSRLLGASEMTIRRDLEQLNKEGLVERIFGGAISVEKTLFEPTLIERDSLNIEAKKRIGVAAASMINEGDTIFLGPGTTTMQIVRNLVNKRDMIITVATNSLRHAWELSKLIGVRLFVIGGELRKKSHTMIGPQAEDSLAGMYVDKLFLGVDGISVEYGLTDPNPVEAKTTQLMIKAAKEVIVVVDHSKFERVGFVKIDKISCVNKIVTDSGLEKKYVQQLEEKEIEVVVV